MLDLQVISEMVTFHMDQMMLVMSEVVRSCWLVIFLLCEDIVLVIHVRLIFRLHNLVLLVARVVQRSSISIFLILTDVHNWVHLLILVSVLIHTATVVVHIIRDDNFHL